MSIVKNLFGTNRVIPEVDETGWGPEVTNTLVDLIDGASSTVTNNKQVPKLSTQATALSASGTLSPTAACHLVSGNGGPITLSASTSISSASEEGRLLYLIGNDAANTVTILDGSNCSLNGHCTLGLYETLALRWSATANLWVEISRNN